MPRRKPTGRTITDRKPRPRATRKIESTQAEWELRLHIAGATTKAAAIPTLVRKLPEPVKKIIGDLSDANKVLVGLDLRQL
jgi:hypothetical protein